MYYKMGSDPVCVYSLLPPTRGGSPIFGGLRTGAVKHIQKLGLGL